MSYDIFRKQPRKKIAKDIRIITLLLFVQRDNAIIKSLIVSGMGSNAIRYVVQRATEVTTPAGVFARIIGPNYHQEHYESLLQRLLSSPETWLSLEMILTALI